MRFCVLITLCLKPLCEAVHFRPLLFREGDARAFAESGGMGQKSRPLRVTFGLVDKRRDASEFSRPRDALGTHEAIIAGDDMTKEDALKIVTHTGDCYRVKTQHEVEPFNFYVSKIGEYCLEQDASGLPYKVVSYHSIEQIERY